MTRVASGAQRSGAATLNLSSRRDDLFLACEFFSCSFFCVPRPGPLLRKRLWARPGGWIPPGSPVPNGSGGGTCKGLISLGSVVPFCGAPRDARAEVRAHVRWTVDQNCRTVELQNQSERLKRLSGSWPVPRFRATKQWAGYSPSSLTSLDQRLIGGGARRNFRGWRAMVERLGENGGNASVLGSGSGRVGMAMLERRGKRVRPQRVVVSRRKPAGLTCGAVQATGGLPAASTGGCPPTARDRNPSSLALTAFWIWADAQSRRWSDPSIGATALISNRQMGSGVCKLRRLPKPRSDDARRSRQADRVRDRGVSMVASGLRGRMGNVGGSCWHVN